MTFQSQSTRGEAPIIVLTEQNKVVAQWFPTFISTSTSSSAMHSAIQAMTAEVVNATKARHHEELTNVELVPILRGALPMYVAAQGLFLETTCVLVRGVRAQGHGKPFIEWLGRKPQPHLGNAERIVLLDTVIATGGTIIQICDELMASSGASRASITVMACYVSPVGVREVAKHPMVEEIIAAAQAEGVGDDGRVIPFPGDIGDKLFGEAEAIV